MLRLIILTFTTLSLYGVNSITISGSPALMSITTATAGSAPTFVQDTSTTYGITTDVANAKITGKINSNAPTGVTISVRLATPTGATTAGLVSMNTTNKNLITAIPINTSTSGLQITYRLSATSKAVPASNVSRTLTLTIQ